MRLQARRLRIMLVVTAVLELGDIVTDCLWVNQLLTMYSARPARCVILAPPAAELLRPA